MKKGGSGVRGVVLVPSKELSKQTYKAIQSLTQFCSREVTVVDLGMEDAEKCKFVLIVVFIADGPEPRWLSNQTLWLAPPFASWHTYLAR